MRCSKFSQYEILNTTLKNDDCKSLIFNEIKNVFYKTQEVRKVFYKT